MQLGTFSQMQWIGDGSLTSLHVFCFYHTSHSNSAKQFKQSKETTEPQKRPYRSFELTVTSFYDFEKKKRTCVNLIESIFPVSIYFHQKKAKIESVK